MQLKSTDVELKKKILYFLYQCIQININITSELLEMINDGLFLTIQTS